MSMGNQGGRPTVMTPEVVKKLEEAFALGCTDLEACFYAGITKPSLYDYQKLHPEFADRKETLKQRPVLLARSVIVDALIDGDRASAHKVIDRKEGSKVTVSGDPDSPLQVAVIERRIVKAGQSEEKQ